MKILKYAVTAAVMLTSAYALRAAAPEQRSAGAEAQPITVYRTATCGCCGKWVDHLKSAGFAPTVHIVADVATTPAGKELPSHLRSCHNGTLEGYNVEGHVPADVLRKLLKERPSVKGIAVPGMPAGSPGMESPNPVAYDVIAYDGSGKTSVFARVGEKR
jgi:hypothetical protein